MLSARCFSLLDVKAPLGVDALAHPWPIMLLYAFPPLSLISPTLASVIEQSLSLILIAPRWPSKHWVAEIIQLLAGNPWPLPLRKDLLSQACREIYHPFPDRICTPGLARERWNLNAVAQVVDTIQNARALPTRRLYSGKWQVFEDWCNSRHAIPYQCYVVDLLCILQELLENGNAFSTIKVYLPAISACHFGFGDNPKLVCRFMKGVRRKLPVSRPLVPLWDLSVVLDALSHHPFEPLEVVIYPSFLLAVCSGGLQGLPAAQSGFCA